MRFTAASNTPYRRGTDDQRCSAAIEQTPYYPDATTATFVAPPEKTIKKRQQNDALPYFNQDASQQPYQTPISQAYSRTTERMVESSTNTTRNQYHAHSVIAT